MPPQRSQEPISKHGETAGYKQQRYAEAYDRAFASGYKVASAMWASFCEDILDSWTSFSPGKMRIAIEWRNRLDGNRGRTSELATRILQRGETKDIAKAYRRVSSVCLDHGVTTAVAAKAKQYFRDAYRAIQGEGLKGEQAMDTLVAACILLAFHHRGDGSERWKSAEDVEEMTGVSGKEITRISDKVRNVIGGQVPELVEDVEGSWDDLEDFDPRYGVVPVLGSREDKDLLDTGTPENFDEKTSKVMKCSTRSKSRAESSSKQPLSRVFSWNCKETGPRNEML